MLSPKFVALAAAVGVAVVAGTTPTFAESASSGKFTNVAFNVAGIPSWLQSNDVSGDKATVAGEIGTYFTKYNYDVIHMQEDFNYHAYIYETDKHPYRTATSGGVLVGSGLNTVSNFPWVDFDRVKWNDCNGILSDGDDCLTPKGFTFMRVKVDDGVYIDFYNLHTDAGTADGDEDARGSNIQQVANYIDSNSKGNAVVVFGDTNSRYTRAKDNIRVFHTQSYLSDAWVTVIRGNSYPASGANGLVCASNPSYDQTCEVVDKFLYRSNGMIDLNATHFEYVGYKFLQDDGSVTSDHDPILVDVSWTLKNGFRQSSMWGGPHGSWFNDLTKIPLPVKTSKLIFRGNERLDSVGLVLSNGQTFKHGGTGGNAYSLLLNSNEYWVSSVLCQGEKSGETRNFYIKATTSSGRTLEAGTSTSDCSTFTAPSGSQIVGFFGQDGDEIDQLGFIYAPQTTVTPNTDGWVRLASSQDPTKCLDFPSGSAQGTSMEIWDCNYQGVQQYTYKDGLIKNKATGWCLDLYNNDKSNGAKVTLWPCNGGATQKWTIESVNGYSRIRLTDTSYCLNDLYNKLDNGSPVSLYTCDSTSASLWVPQNEPDITGTFTLKSGINSTWCLDFPLGEPASTQLETWECNKGANQFFTYRNGQIINESNQLCLDVLFGVYQNGQNVQLYNCNGGANQKWSIYADTATGANQVRVKGTNYCLNSLSNAAATKIGLHECSSGSTSSAWAFSPIP